MHYVNKHPEPQRIHNAVKIAHAILADSPKCSEERIEDACRAAWAMVAASYWGVGNPTVEQVKELLIIEHFCQEG
jgi:hypothetical protein